MKSVLPNWAYGGDVSRVVDADRERRGLEKGGGVAIPEPSVPPMPPTMKRAMSPREEARPLVRRTKVTYQPTPCYPVLLRREDSPLGPQREGAPR